MEEYESQAPSRVGGCLVQAVSHGAALVLGAVLGIGGARVAEYYSDPEMLSRPEGELSRAELIKKLAPTSSAAPTTVTGLSSLVLARLSADALRQHMRNLRMQG